MTMSPLGEAPTTTLGGGLWIRFFLRAELTPSTHRWPSCQNDASSISAKSALIIDQGSPVRKRQMLPLEGGCRWMNPCRSPRRSRTSGSVMPAHQIYPSCQFALASRVISFARSSMSIAPHAGEGIRLGSTPLGRKQ
jgi:hypothetical protein